MMELCQHVVKTGEIQGADEIEAMWVKNTTTTIKAQLGEINEASMTKNEGMRIRLIKDKALGLVFTYRLDKDSINEAVKKALHAAQASKSDEHWVSLPSPGKYPHLDLWDSTMETVDSKELMAPVSEMLQAVPEDILVYLAANSVELTQRACVNSNGIEHADRATIEEFGMAATGKVKDGVTPAFQEIDILRKYNPIPQNIVEPLIEQINFFKKEETASSGKSQIIFSPDALESLFRYTVFKALSGDNVARGKSLLSGKEGEKIASSLVTIHDNGIQPEGANAKEMDDEGIPCQDTPLLENGTLQGFIWNDYWAKRMNVSSTGNADYDSRTDEMSIQQSVMALAPGDHTVDDILSVRDGYYVLGLQGAHASNPESGDFSVLCTPAFRIKNEEIAGGVTGMMLSDNVFSLLKKIDAVGKEPKVLEVSVLPHVRFTDVNVAAK